MVQYAHAGHSRNTAAVQITDSQLHESFEGRATFRCTDNTISNHAYLLKHKSTSGASALPGLEDQTSSLSCISFVAFRQQRYLELSNITHSFNRGSETQPYIIN